jgi:hypothetical protein
MAGILWRVLIAVICVVLTFALVPPFLRIIGLTPSADVMLIVRVCVAGLAILYVLAGTRWTPPAP